MSKVDPVVLIANYEQNRGCCLSMLTLGGISPGLLHDDEVDTVTSFYI